MRNFLPFIFSLITTVHFAQVQPALLEPGVISNNGVFGFTLSPDGNEAFWVKSKGGRDTLFIVQSKKVNGAWNTPQVASFSTGAGLWKDIDPVFSPDGKTVLFQSTRPVPGMPGRTGFDIWAADRTRSGWGAPYHLGAEINSDAAESFASMTKSGSIYFMMDNPDGKGSSDIYVSRRQNGKYQKPENLGAPINTPFRESNPYISADENYIIYFSSDSTGYGDVDLFISWKKDNTWSLPVNIGKPINTEIGEFCPFYHAKEGRLYFSRTTQTATKRRKENIYWSPFDPSVYKGR